ncbi:MAG: oligosaccharide flippase family protein [Geminicoccaceae bacterium]
MSTASRLTGSMALLSIAKVASIALSLATLGLLTRSLGTDGFGDFRNVTAYLNLALLASNLGLYLIFVREISAEGADQARIISSGVTLRLVTAAVVLVAAAAVAWVLPYSDAVRLGILLCVPGFVALALSQLLGGLFQEKLRQAGVVVAELAGGILMLALTLALGLAGAGVLPMLAVFVFGNLLTLAIAWRFAQRLVPFRPAWDLGVWRGLMLPALPLAGANLLQLVYYRADTVFLGMAWPATEVGLYGVATRILDTFVGIAALYTGLVMPLMSREAKRDRPAMERHLRDGFDVLALGSVGAAMLTLLFAPDIANLIAGEAFRDAATPLRVLAAMILIYPLCMICRYAVTAIDHQKALLPAYVAAAIAGIGSFLFLIRPYGAGGAAAGLIVSELILFGASISILRRHDVSPSYSAMAKSIGCAAVVMLAWLTTSLGSWPWLVGIAACGVLYLILLLVSGAVPRPIVKAAVQRASRLLPAPSAPPVRPEISPRVPPLPFEGQPMVDWLDRKLAWSAQQLAMYAGGCVIFSLGVKLFLDAAMGADPLSSMIVGIVGQVDLPWVGFGFVSAVVTATFLLFWSVWNRRWPPLSTFVTMALVGYLVDLWNMVGLERITGALLDPVPMMLAAVVFDAYACALIIMSGIGIRVMDLVAIAMVRRLGWPFLAAKLLQECAFLSIGWLLGGPVGVGTIAFLIVVGCFIPPFMWMNGRFLRLPNYGLAPMSAPQGAH